MRSTFHLPTTIAVSETSQDNRLAPLTTRHDTHSVMTMLIHVVMFMSEVPTSKSTGKHPVSFIWNFVCCLSEWLTDWVDWFGTHSMESHGSWKSWKPIAGATCLNFIGFRRLLGCRGIQKRSHQSHRCNVWRWFAVQAPTREATKLLPFFFPHTPRDCLRLFVRSPSVRCLDWSYLRRRRKRPWLGYKFHTQLMEFKHAVN